MDSEIVKVSDARVQSLGLKFTFSTEGDKLIIEASCSKDNQKYVGEIIANPYVDLQDIKELLSEGQFKILLKNEEILKIKAGAVPIELLPKQKSEIKELKETLIKSLEKQEQMQGIIDFQNAQLNKHENMIRDLKTTVEELKSSPKATTLMVEEMRGQFSQKIKQLKESFQSETSAIKNEQQSYSQSSSETQRKIGQFSASLTQIKGQINKIKDDMIISRKTIDDLKETIKIQTGNLRTQITDLSNKNQNHSTVIDKLQESLRNEIKENKKIIDDHEDRLKKLADNCEIKLNTLEKSNQKIRGNLKQQVNNLIEKVNPFIKKIEQEKEKQQQRIRMIESFKWSEQLKSQNIKISGNVVTLTKELQIQNRLYSQFCLLNASFTNTIKSKQSWAIKINKNKGGIDLGVSLKSKMIEYKFNAQNMNRRKTGHGLYMIGSIGRCFSHSQKEFNNVNKSFKFGSGDVIYIEYDPIESKLRFSKNKVDYFEMPIIAPPQNDAYHPCVSLCGQNESVELIQPNQLNK